MKHILSFAVIAAVTLSPICYSAQYVFPAQGQTPETQKADEEACIAWATAQTGYNPTAATAAVQATPAPVAAESTAGTEKQRGGALKGAAIASGVAAITDNDKSDAAAAGAVVGLVGQRSSNRRAERNAAETEAQQPQTAPAPAAAPTASAAEFEKANAACLTGKGYTVQ
ncbi:hypothetical protein [Shewanella sp. KJ2020]|uniref:hypothetical protein n=1 Tax=Shewanella sp. KJ2020 TaxID=2919172 RepID=UPI0020A7495F|nr:hypothetical protein [Shewanella sp. KJ2020]MCP3128210.1 hypothetical protein [Shewanella sp. KJ2020]